MPSRMASGPFLAILIAKTSLSGRDAVTEENKCLKTRPASFRDLEVGEKRTFRIKQKVSCGIDSTEHLQVALQDSILTPWSIESTGYQT